MTREENRERVRRQRARMYREAGRVYVKGTGSGRRYSKPIVVSEEELDRRAMAMDHKESRCY